MSDPIPQPPNDVPADEFIVVPKSPKPPLPPVPLAPQYSPPPALPDAPQYTPGEMPMPGQVIPEHPQAGQIVPVYPVPGAPAAHPARNGVAPYAPAMQPMPQAPQSNGIAVAGFIVGLVSVFLPLILGLGVGVTGLVMSIVGINRAKITGSGRGLAIAGMVLSIVGIVLLL